MRIYLDVGRLINESVTMVNPTDMAYVSAGYAPLSARLVQNLSAPGNAPE